MFKNSHNKFTSLVKRGALTVVGLGAAVSAHAAVDVSAITDTMTDIAAVGAAVFAVYVAVKAIKLIRRAL